MVQCCQWNRLATPFAFFAFPYSVAILRLFCRHSFWGRLMRKKKQPFLTRALWLTGVIIPISCVFLAIVLSYFVNRQPTAVVVDQQPGAVVANQQPGEVNIATGPNSIVIVYPPDASLSTPTKKGHWGLNLVLLLVILIHTNATPHRMISKHALVTRLVQSTRHPTTRQRATTRPLTAHILGIGRQTAHTLGTRHLLIQTRTTIRALIIQTRDI